MTPLVSILTPSFNRADLYPETLASLRAQTYPHWEELVVDDGSSDECCRVMQQLIKNEPRVQWIDRNRDPKGACACRNIGVEQCTGKYLIFLDTDDLLAAHCLEQRVAVMEQNPDLDFAVFSMVEFNQQHDDLKLLWGPVNATTLLDSLLTLNPICQGTGTIWRKGAFLRLGLWDESLAIWQDIELHLRACLRGFRFQSFQHLPPDGYIRRSPGSLSRGEYHSKTKIESRFQVLQKTYREFEQANQITGINGLRWIFASVAASAARTREERLLEDIVAWGASRSILSRTEMLRLKLACGLLRRRGSQLPLVSALWRFLFRPFLSIEPERRPFTGPLAVPFQVGSVQSAESNGRSSQPSRAGSEI